MKYIELNETNIQMIIPVYIEDYTYHQNNDWSYEILYKRVHQIITREDSYSVLMEKDHKIIGFALGYMEQYNDGLVYNLVEIMISPFHQRQGLGTMLMLELEKRVKEKGAFMIQLQSVNDDMHDYFYGKLGYKNCNNLILKAKDL